MAQIFGDAGLNASVIPQVWAENALIILYKNLKVAALAYRDFEQNISSFGDVVNTRKYAKLPVNDWAGHFGYPPYQADGTFTPQGGDTSPAAQNNSDGQSIPYVDTTNVIKISRPQVFKLPVRLNKFKYTAYIEEDVIKTTSMANIRKEVIAPAAIPLAETVDSDVVAALLPISQDYRAHSIAQIKTTGTASGGAARPLISDDIVSAMDSLNQSLCPTEDRSLVLSSKHQADALRVQLFTAALYAGDVTALERAILGDKYGFKTYWTQNIPSLSTSSATAARSLAFHKNAVALVMRPLAPIDTPGAVSSVVQQQDTSLRISVGYNQLLMGTVVTLATLYGTQLLDADLACYIQDDIV